MCGEMGLSRAWAHLYKSSLAPRQRGHHGKITSGSSQFNLDSSYAFRLLLLSAISYCSAVRGIRTEYSSGPQAMLADAPAHPLASRGNVALYYAQSLCRMALVVSWNVLHPRASAGETCSRNLGVIRLWLDLPVERMSAGGETSLVIIRARDALEWPGSCLSRTRTWLVPGMTR